ncbi:MarR family transcriptional regulator [Nocardia sp. R6R-6]|uniref:MarR family transcriptional regulator n=1 Tax=Nocardia sp. R6R-6 TaxID=3459303 RepID=UPI00403DD9E0
MTSEDDALATAFAGLHREVRAIYGIIARRLGITMQQAELLCALDGRQPSFGELAALLGCDKTNVTGMVDRLERRGFLVREADAADRRITRVVLTRPGMAVRGDIRAALAEELTDRLPRTDRARLIAQLTKAASALADNR